MDQGRTYFIMFTMLAFVENTITGSSIFKCLSARDDVFRLGCESEDHVIYNPTIFAGISDSGTCAYKTSNCRGLTSKMMERIRRCHWQRECFLSFNNLDRMVYEEGSNCSGKTPDYVVIEHPNCIPKNSTINICTKDRNKLPQGVIRSHSGFPFLMNLSKNRRCKWKIEIPKDQTLFLSLDEVDVNKRDKLQIKRIYNNTKRRLKLLTGKKFVLSGNTTNRVEIRFQTGSGGIRLNRGFIIPFAVYGSEDIMELDKWPKTSYPVLKDMGIIRREKAFAEQCTEKPEGKLTIFCAENELIYSPKVMAAGAFNELSICVFGPRRCIGITPELIAQRNHCFWRKSCDYHWDGVMPLVYTNKMKCMGFLASLLVIENHECIDSAKIYDVCTNETDTIRGDWGLVRSHATYPWQFDTKLGRCKRNIRIGSNRQLYLLGHDINLDPDGRDKIQVYHIKDGKKTLKLDTKNITSGKEFNFEEGEIQIRFTPSRVTKSGRGFTLLFNKNKLEQFTPEKNPTPEHLSDAPLVPQPVIDQQNKPVRPDLSKTETKGNKKAQEKKKTRNKKRKRKRGKGMPSFLERFNV